MDGGPGGRGEEIVTKSKRRYNRAGKKKVRNINRKKPKKHGEEEIHSYVMAGIGSKPIHA